MWPLSTSLSTRQPGGYRAHSAHAAGRGPESPFLKFIIGGGVTILFELSGGHTLEMLKIVKQTSTDSYPEILRRITAQKGLAGLLDGFVPWGALQAVAKGSVFSWGQAASMGLMHDVEGVSKGTKTIISGGVGGFVQGIAMSPLLLLKTRVMTDPAFRATGGVLATAAASAAVGGRIIATEGPAALFKGVSVFSAKRTADWTTRYLFVVMAEDAMRPAPGAKLSSVAEAGASLVGGATSAFVTIPLDVMVASMQSAGAAGKRMGIYETFRKQYDSGHITRGLVARIAHVALTTMVMKNVTVAVYDAYEAVFPPAKKNKADH